MMERGLVQQFHLTVEAVNGKLVREFETGSDPASVARRVGDILVPAIHILQARTNNNPSGKDSTILEEVNVTDISLPVIILMFCPLSGPRTLGGHD